MANRADRRGDEPITNVSPWGRATDRHPTRDFPSWPGRTIRPPKGRRYDCSRPYAIELELDPKTGGVQIRFVRKLIAFEQEPSVLLRKLQGPEQRLLLGDYARGHA